MMPTIETKQMTPLQALEEIKDHCKHYYDAELDHMAEYLIVESALKALETIQTTAVMELCMAEVKADHNLIEEIIRIRKTAFETALKLTETKKQLVIAHKEIERLRDKAYPRNPSGE